VAAIRGPGNCRLKDLDLLTEFQHTGKIHNNFVIIVEDLDPELFAGSGSGINNFGSGSGLQD
jgi:hypothetical protein